MIPKEAKKQWNERNPPWERGHPALAEGWKPSFPTCSLRVSGVAAAMTIDDLMLCNMMLL